MLLRSAFWATASRAPSSTVCDMTRKAPRPTILSSMDRVIDLYFPAPSVNLNSKE